MKFGISYKTTSFCRDWFNQWWTDQTFALP